MPQLRDGSGRGGRRELTLMTGNGLTPFAWAFMLLSMGAVSWLAFWCFYRILTSGSSYGTEDSGPGRGGPTPGAGGGAD